jgi:hypothetical protein
VPIISVLPSPDPKRITMEGSSHARFNLEVDGVAYELVEAEFKGVLFEVVTMLVFEQLVDSSTFILEAG